MINGWSISCGIALRWKSLNRIDVKSTLVQVMAWCRQASSHYLSQCWPRSVSPCGVTRPQWFKRMPSHKHRPECVCKGNKLSLNISQCGIILLYGQKKVKVHGFANNILMLHMTYLYLCILRSVSDGVFLSHHDVIYIIIIESRVRNLKKKCIDMLI